MKWLYSVDHHLNAKIADLELGTEAEQQSVDGSVDDSERDQSGALFSCLKSCLFGAELSSHNRDSDDEGEENIESGTTSAAVVEEAEDEESKHNDEHKKKSRRKSLGKKSNKKGGKMKAEDFLANWAAPEVVADGRHSQASDVYSFALVLWEILTGLVPFSSVKKQDDIRLKVRTFIRMHIILLSLYYKALLLQ